MNYDRGTVEHAARTLHHADTGTTLPPNTELTAEQRIVLDGYLARAERALAVMRIFAIDELVAVDRARQEAA